MSKDPAEHASNYHDQVTEKQKNAAAQAATHYDFIVCGSGTSGSVVARRLAENSNATVLVLEAGGTEDVAEVHAAEAWIANLGSNRDWAFTAPASAQVNGRSIALHMGKILGGGSSINAMHWSRGHQSDWDLLASEGQDDDWSYASVLDLYRRIEDWQGVSDPQYRGEGGLVHVGPAPALSQLPHAWMEAAKAFDIPRFESQNGKIMEGLAGSSMADVCIKDGRRMSIFRSYLYPIMLHPNVTVLTNALVARVLFEGKRAVGIECVIDGQLKRFYASSEVILSLGAVHTPKVLMQSGIGDAGHLRNFDIPVIEDLKGVGRNLQDHCMATGCIWECPENPETESLPHGAIVQTNAFLRSSAARVSPDIQLMQLGLPFASEEISRQYQIVPKAWTMIPVLARPQSTGHIKLTGARPEDPVTIEANMLADPADVAALANAIEIVSDIAHSASLKPFVKRQLAPGLLARPSLENFLRDSVASINHLTCTAKMGNDADSVVDSKLQVHGFEGLTIADGSVLRRVTTGNTMAPCVIIGERAAASIRQRHSV